MRHAIMRSCKHARRAPSADAAAQSQHAGHVSALGEAQLLVERPGALVLDVHVELYLLGLGLGSDHRMRSGVCDRDGAHLADRAERAEPCEWVTADVTADSLEPVTVHDLCASLHLNDGARCGTQSDALSLARRLEQCERRVEQLLLGGERR